MKSNYTHIVVTLSEIFFSRLKGTNVTSVSFSFTSQTRIEIGDIKPVEWFVLLQFVQSSFLQRETLFYYGVAKQIHIRDFFNNLILISIYLIFTV